MADTGPTSQDDSSPTLPQAARELLADLRGLVTDRVHLLSLELQRATDALGRMALLVVLAGTLFATAWFALWAGLVAAGIALGLAWPWAVLIALAVNLSGAGWALQRARRLAPRLALSATLRHLNGFGHEEERDESPERDA